MASDERPMLGRVLSIRLPAQLDSDLRQAAAREFNSDSALARRLIATGLARERSEPVPPTPAPAPGEAA